MLDFIGGAGSFLAQAVYVVLLIYLAFHAYCWLRWRDSWQDSWRRFWR